MGKGEGEERWGGGGGGGEEDEKEARGDLGRELVSWLFNAQGTGKAYLRNGSA